MRDLLACFMCQCQHNELFFKVILNLPLEKLKAQYIFKAQSTVNENRCLDYDDIPLLIGKMISN